MKKLKLLTVLMAILMTTNVYAKVQSRPGVAGKVSTNASDFFMLIRDMEKEGGALGLSATFSENEITGEYEETSNSNNIDSHMCKNTEWGAVAMLSASDYGVGNGKVGSGYNESTKTYSLASSTTGNISGVFGMSSGATHNEYMAAGITTKMKSTYNKYLINSSSKYVDKYADSSDKKDYSRYIPGDATYELLSIASIYGEFVYSSQPVFGRGTGGIFNAYASSGYASSGYRIYSHWF